jgi:hypothetical protein
MAMLKLRTSDLISKNRRQKNQHKIQLRSMDLQKMKWEIQMLAEIKIRLTQLERGGGDRKDGSM